MSEGSTARASGPFQAPGGYIEQESRRTVIATSAIVDLTGSGANGHKGTTKMMNNAPNPTAAFSKKPIAVLITFSSGVDNRKGLFVYSGETRERYPPSIFATVWGSSASSNSCLLTSKKCGSRHIRSRSAYTGSTYHGPCIDSRQLSEPRGRPTVSQNVVWVVRQGIL